MRRRITAIGLIATLLCSGGTTHAADLDLPGVTATPTDAPRKGVSWAAPPPEGLQYAFTASFEMAMTEPDEPTPMPAMGMVIDGSATARPSEHEGADWALHNGEIEIAHVREGTRNPGGTQVPDTLAPILLHSAGRGLAEVDGPTSLWAAYGTFTGLVLFWPDLPRRSRPGSKTSWSFDQWSRSSGAEVEVRRGTIEVPEGYEFGEPASLQHDAQVVLDSWIDVDGTPAAVLIASWEVLEEATQSQEIPLSDDSPPVRRETHTRALQRCEARWVVLQTGHLLYASLSTTNHVTMHTRSGDEDDGMDMQQLHTLTAECRLVGAPSGPVLAPFTREIPPAEALLDAHLALRDALWLRDRDAAAALIAPEVLEAHGRDVVLDLLIGHVHRYSVRVLGYPELAPGVECDDQGCRTSLHGSALHLRQDDRSWDRISVHTEVRGVGPTIGFLGTDRVQGRETWDLLEVSAGRLHTGAGDGFVWLGEGAEATAAQLARLRKRVPDGTCRVVVIAGPSPTEELVTAGLAEIRAASCACTELVIDGEFGPTEVLDLAVATPDEVRAALAGGNGE